MYFISNFKYVKEQEIHRTATEGSPYIIFIKTIIKNELYKNDNKNRNN